MAELYGLDCPICDGIGDCTRCRPGIRYQPPEDPLVEAYEEARQMFPDDTRSYW